MPVLAEKNWDRYVARIELVARTDTGLLTLPAAAAVRQVWAVDVSVRMRDYLVTKARSAEQPISA